MYAIVRAGGKQYRVQEKDTIIVEKIEAGVGDAITLGEVLAVGGGEDGARFGTPTVAGASVSGTVVRQGRGRKIHGYTYIKVKGHQRHYGHRQPETHVRIEKIQA